MNEIKKRVKEFWDMEKEHKKSKDYVCYPYKKLSEYTHFMFSDFLFYELDLHKKGVNKQHFEIYCYELLTQGEKFIKNIKRFKDEK